MNQSAYMLITHCYGCSAPLACDNCNSIEELKVTFIDAYSHYLGKKPSSSTVDKFIANHRIVAHNGIPYEFVY